MKSDSRRRRRTNAFLIIAVLLFTLVQPGQAGAGDASWMLPGKYGIFMHYQYRILLGYSIKTKPQFPDPAQMNAAEWNRFVDGFDAQGFARQMAEAKAGWVIFCLDDHYFAWPCAPNKAFSEYTGYAPGEKCSRRDLIRDVAEALNARGVKLICYFAGLNGYMKEPNVSAGLLEPGAGRGEFNERTPPSAEGRKRRLAVLREYADRYKDKVAGWWFDGIAPNTYQAEPDDWQTINAIVHSANPKAVIAFSYGANEQACIRQGIDDYTAGDTWSKQDLKRLTPAILPAQAGLLWHGKVYCGTVYHGQGDANQFGDQELIDWIKTCNSQGGVCTLDWPFDPKTGLLKDFGFEQAKRIARAVESARQNKEPVDYVNPNIGGIGQLLSATSPNVVMPYGMMRISPITTPGITDRYLADKIYGFPAGGMTLMPMTGSAETDPAKYASMYDHDLETATPYYYAAILEKHDIRVEYTVSAHAAYYRLTFPTGAAARVLFSAPQSGKIDLTNNTALNGSSGGGRGGRGGYFYAEFSRPASSFQTLTGVPPLRGRAPGGGGGLGIMADFSPDQGGQVGIRVGMSNISLDQARQNLRRELPAWDFARARERARTAWNQALSKIEVKGGTEDQRTIFYTSLYRVLTSVSDVTEDGRYHGSFDQQVHSADGHGFYPIGAGAAMWGNYRSLEPVHLLLDPREQVDLVRSFLTLYERTGRMMAINRGLSGHHIIAVALDAYMKGYRDFDVAKAYEAFKKMQMEETFLPWRNVPQTSLDRVYLEKGFFPALKKGEKETVKEVHPFERRQAVAVTLETAYDDWCMAEWAKALNQKEDYEYFWKRAHNYENVFDKRVGFMAPKSEDGNWVLDGKEFSPIWSGGQGGREYYTEMNGWIYTFHVQQDVAGLINLMGGRDKFVAKLNTLFQDQFEGFSGAPEPFRGGGSKYFFQAQFPDMTGLIGQYAQGNEPAFHIPYLYNYAGAPWMTQRRVRDIMKIWFNAGPTGISGDEDNGEESSWYVLSAMGFFTVCPGRPVYDIGSPIFDEVKLHLAGGKVFTITARNVSAANKYIQSAALNGKPLNRPWFEHKDLVSGGALVLEMGPRPNTAWGSAPEAAPPSMSH